MQCFVAPMFPVDPIEVQPLDSFDVSTLRHVAAISSPLPYPSPHEPRDWKLAHRLYPIVAASRDTAVCTLGVNVGGTRPRNILCKIADTSRYVLLRRDAAGPVWRLKEIGTSCRQPITQRVIV